MIEQEIAGRTAWFARPNGSPRGAVVVCHGGGGLGPHERGVIDKLAELGYAAVAPDLFGDPAVAEARRLSEAGEPVPDALRGRTISIIRGLVGQPARLRERVLAAIDWIGAQGSASNAEARSQIAVIGYCFGGTAALEAARSGADLACAVSFHGGLVAVEPAAKIATPVLACAGGADPHCPPEQRAAFDAEMTRAGADWQLHVYGGALHAFTVRGSEKIPGCAYYERADRRSWAAMLQIFDETMGA